MRIQVDQKFHLFSHLQEGGKAIDDQALVDAIGREIRGTQLG